MITTAFCLFFIALGLSVLLVATTACYVVLKGLLR